METLTLMSTIKSWKQCLMKSSMQGKTTEGNRCLMMTMMRSLSILMKIPTTIKLKKVIITKKMINLTKKMINLMKEMINLTKKVINLTKKKILLQITNSLMATAS
uniref:Uncharacterized protein n=1 Tax=Cacopsylla melanoneura TaxID=428564 RepID=A0A8D8U3Y7_9HEMI